MNIKPSWAAVAAALALSGPASAGYIVDTGTPQGGPNWSLGNFQYFGGEFVVANATVINGIDGYFQTSGGGTMDFAIHADAGNVPGLVLFTRPSVIAADTPLGWYGVSGLGWALAAGTYWVSFRVDGEVSGAMPGTAPDPLGEYAQGSGNLAWQDRGANFFDYLDIGVRIDASAQSVPEPSTLALAGGCLAGLGLGRRKRRV